MTAPDYPFPGGSPLDPPPRLAEIRATAPISRVALASGPAWLLTRHADVRAAIAEPDLQAFMPGLFEGTDAERDQAAEAGFLMMADGPAHQRLRRPLAGAMSARRIAELRPRIERRAHELVGLLADSGGGEIVRELAAPLAIDALGALIGVDVTARPDFARWSDDSAAMFGGSDPQAMAETGEKLFGFIGELVAAERDGDGLIGDLYRLVPGDGVALTDAEVTGLVGQLLMAGYVPTAMVAALSVHRVLRDPDLVEAAVRADPDASPGLVEELLRLDPGAAGTVDRVVRARRPIELGGRTFAEGDVLVLPLGAANRDPDVFADPDRIDPYRRPNPHLSFFPGPHHCVGAALARTVLGVMIEALLERPVALDGEPSWTTGVLGETQLKALPVYVTTPAPSR